MNARFILRQSFLFSLIFLLLATLFVSCKKRGQQTDVENSAEEKSDEELYSFYSPAEDDASWVEELLMHIEEERIAEELSKMEDSLTEYQIDETPPELSETEEFAESEETQAEEKVFIGKNNEMRFFEYNNEILMPQYTEDGLIIIHSADGNVVRNFYNNDYQLVKKEEWKIASASDAKKLRSEIFVYSEETGKVIKKDILTDTDVETVNYNSDSSPVASVKYILKDEKRYLIMERNWLYDEQNRILKDEQKEYSYKDSDFENKPVLFSKRYEYDYKNTDSLNSEKDAEDTTENTTDNTAPIPPDSKYFENDVLKMQNQYTKKKGTYLSRIYFDSVFSVITYYEDDFRLRDEYYNNGRLFRTKVYERVGEGN